MHNWSTDEQELQKDPKAHAIWKMEQLVNFGLDEHEKLSRTELMQYWNELTLDPLKKRYLAFLLWGKRS